MWSSIECAYLEGENITCAQCSWSGPCAYKFIGVTPPCTSQTAQTGYDRPGADIKTLMLPGTDWEACSDVCCNDDSCAGWVFVANFTGSFMDCTPLSNCCFLKGSNVQPVPSQVRNIVTGARNGRIPTASPTIGIRSAVPLGGLGAGALELRADGTFHEVGILVCEVPSPAG
jgi:hypothetical protein